MLRRSPVLCKTNLFRQREVKRDGGGGGLGVSYAMACGFLALVMGALASSFLLPDAPSRKSAGSSFEELPRSHVKLGPGNHIVVNPGHIPTEDPKQDH
ncbi:hypothetical protein DIPPA_22114 [Diplonema papillatum]|nr:hypothetical protein DIPPA_22114 [Diplonema papillatum]